VTTASLLGVLALAFIAHLVGARLLARTSRLRGMGAFLVIAGLGAAGLVALGHFTARFGPALLWFRAPTFFVAIALLLGGAVWWLRQPFPLPRRLGVLAGIAALVGGLLAFSMLDGRGTPPAMLMPTLNRAAPDIAYVDSSGVPRKLSELKGEVVLINFWATWCAPCRREMPLLAKMQREYEPQRFRVLYLSLEDADVLAGFVKAHPFDGIQGRITAAPPFYDAGRYYPLSYLVNRDGRVVARWSGRPAEGWLSDTIERQL
jgi:thiol-disulfide isomerase/thioredoxin